MIFLRVIFCVIIVVGLGFFLGKLDHRRHPELTVYGWIGAGIIMLVMRFIL